jgi:hypothetical protein
VYAASFPGLGFLPLLRAEALQVADPHHGKPGLVRPFDDQIHVKTSGRDVVLVKTRALIGDSFDGQPSAQRADGDFDVLVGSVFVAEVVGESADFEVERVHVGVAEFEERPHDVFAGVVLDVADAAAPVFAENRKAKSVVVQHDGLGQFERRGAMAVVTRPLGDGFGVEIGTVGKVKHSHAVWTWR